MPSPFVTAIKAAVHNYTASFTSGHPKYTERRAKGMSERRKVDIANILKGIDDPNVLDVDKKRNIANALKIIKKGRWYTLDIGGSDLKSEVQAVMRLPEYTDMSLLRQEAIALRIERDAYREKYYKASQPIFTVNAAVTSADPVEHETADQKEIADEFARLEDVISAKEQRIKTLESTLDTQNKRMDELERANHKLAQKMSKLLVDTYQAQSPAAPEPRIAMRVQHEPVPIVLPTLFASS